MEQPILSGKVLQPVSQEVNGMSQSGPKILVFLSFSNFAPESVSPEVAYWEALREADVTNGIGEFAWINAHLSSPLLAPQVLDEDIQRQMMNCFLEPEVRNRITPNAFPGATPVVFNRIGSLLAIRHLILYGTIEPRNWNPYSVGRLALLANDFVPQPSQPKSNPPSSLELSLLMLPTWDVNNVRNLGHAMSRIFTMLTEILPGNDSIVRNLASQLAISSDRIEIDGMPLSLFSSIVFALYAYARPQSSPPRVWFNVNEIFAQTGLSTEFLSKLLAARAKTMDGFRESLAKGEPLSQSAFLGELRRKQFLVDSLNVFRRYPFLKLDSERFLMLDVQFLSELLTAGVYWSIHDSLPMKQRGTFKHLWGRMFEVYVVSLLAEFYPETSRMLSADIQYSGRQIESSGQIDALVDFGDIVLLFEVKSSLLTEPAKRRSDEGEFLFDFRRKFVENEDAKPKAIKQLAHACAAILEGTVKTAKVNSGPLLYPILITDEPCLETTFANTFFNEQFQKELASNEKVRPLTVMSIDELESTLAHVPDNDFGWRELLESRFDRNTVLPNSAGQAIVDLCFAKGIAPKQNRALKRKYDEFGGIIRSVFEKF